VTGNFIAYKNAVLSQRWPRGARYINESNEPLRRYGHSKLSKMAACRQLGFDVTGNSAIRSANPENPTLEPNMNCIGSPVAEIWPFAYLGGIWNPVLWGRVGRMGSVMAPFERTVVVFCRLSIVTVALSITIRPHLQSNVSDAQINMGWVTLGQNFPWSRPLMFGSTLYRERTSQANWWWNYFRRIPTCVITLRQRYRQTDGQTTWDRKTALCTKVHRAVKTRDIHTVIIAENR